MFVSPHWKICSVAKSRLSLCNTMDCRCQAPLCFPFYRSLFRCKSIESEMLSKHLIFCCPLFLLPSIFPSFRVFSSESALCIRWPKYWSFSFSISPSNEYSGLISVRNDCVAYCSCIVTSEIRKCESSNFLLLFQIVLTVWIPCNSIWICWPVFPFMQKKCWNLDGYCIQYVTILDSVNISTVCLPVHEYRMFFHLVGFNFFHPCYIIFSVQAIHILG